MNNKTEKIRKFSKVVCILLNIAIGVFIALGASVLFAWLLSGSNLPTEIVTINGVATEIPYLFKLGEIRIFMPVIWKSGFDFSGIQALVPGFDLSVGFGDFIGVIFTIVTLLFTKKVFMLLREIGSPFREDIIIALKRLTIALLIMGGVSGVIPFLAAGIVWVLSLIFDYGRALQDESDTKL